MASTPKGTIPPALIPAVPGFPAVRILENGGGAYLSTPVTGATRNGSNQITEIGDDNEPILDLTERTEYLKVRTDQLPAVQTAVANHTLWLDGYSPNINTATQSPLKHTYIFQQLDGATILAELWISAYKLNELAILRLERGRLLPNYVFDGPDVPEGWGALGPALTPNGESIVLFCQTIVNGSAQIAELANVQHQGVWQAEVMALRTDGLFGIWRWKLTIRDSVCYLQSLGLGGTNDASPQPFPPAGSTWTIMPTTIIVPLTSNR